MHSMHFKKFVLIKFEKKILSNLNYEESSKARDIRIKSRNKKLLRHIINKH